eukprot:UN05112
MMLSLLYLLFCTGRSMHLLISGPHYRSHWNVLMAIGEEALNRGHEVTMLAPKSITEHIQHIKPTKIIESVNGLTIDGVKDASRDLSTIEIISNMLTT